MKKTIIVNNVSKKYKLYHSTKERILDLISPKSHGEDFFALRDVSFEAQRGDSIGFIGVNGSGKSTLSNIIAGIVPETSGIVEVIGQTSLIAVAAGLKPDLTGRDNIELKCLMLGFSKEEIKALEPAIIEFSELDNFIDQPVKSYSSGMRSRLGFAISVNVDPDILIIDEALSVGDRAFAEKSLAKMQEFREQEKTMIFVSHSIGQMKQFCEKILWLEYGMVKAFGTVEEVIPKYESFLNQWQKMSKVEREQYKSFALRQEQKGLDELISKDDQMQIATKDNIYLEQPTSLLGHIKGRKSFVYSTPTNLKERQSSEKYKNSVYYIKKQANSNGELFYLLSIEPSAKNGGIGWMKASDISSHIHVVIDNDPGKFSIKGSGSGYNLAWGGPNDCNYPDLTLFKNAEFIVNKIEMVGNNLWYGGILDGEQTWVHNNHLSEL